MSTSHTDNLARDLYQVLDHHLIMHDAPGRKRLAMALAEEGIPVAELRRKCQRLNTVDAWVRFLTNGKKNGPTNTMTDRELSAAEQVNVDYILERVNTDGKSPEFVAEQMGWSLERVQDILDRHQGMTP